MFRITMLVVAASLLIAAGATAEVGDVGGTIVHIDPMAHTITYSDGRIVHYDPLWRIVVNGRPVALAELAPGSVVAVRPGAPARVVAPGSPQPAMAPASPAVVTGPPAVGTPGRPAVERTTQTFILPDGRTLQVTEVEMWRGRPAYRTEPGMVIGVPVAAVADPRVIGPVPAPVSMNARVQSVDSRGTVIVFTDGQTVLIPARTIYTTTPATVVTPTASGTVVAPAVAVTELKPGDQVSVELQEVVPIVAETSTIRTRDARGAMVAQGDRLFPTRAVVFEDQVVLIRYPQAL